jgi:hypothetical protein
MVQMPLKQMPRVWMAVLAGGILTAAYLLQRWMHRQQAHPRLGIWRDHFFQVAAFNRGIGKVSTQNAGLFSFGDSGATRGHRVKKSPRLYKIEQTTSS